jgi:hypothetical protein
MSDDVVSIDEYRPHETGGAGCLACGHEWVAVVPVMRDAGLLECPRCHMMAGAFSREGGIRWEVLRSNYILKDGETFERDVLPVRCRAKYELHIETIRRVAREYGYAIGVHGSLARDIDLIAVPWTSEASPNQGALVGEIAGAVGGIIDMGSVPGRGADTDHREPVAKPHGRICWTVHLGGGPYIDLSVMPLRGEGSKGK